MNLNINIKSNEAKTQRKRLDKRKTNRKVEKIKEMEVQDKRRHASVKVKRRGRI